MLKKKVSKEVQEVGEQMQFPSLIKQNLPKIRISVDAGSAQILIATKLGPNKGLLDFSQEY